MAAHSFNERLAEGFPVIRDDSGYRDFIDFPDGGIIQSFVTDDAPVGVEQKYLLTPMRPGAWLILAPMAAELTGSKTITYIQRDRDARDTAVPIITLNGNERTSVTLSDPGDIAMLIAVPRDPSDAPGKYRWQRFGFDGASFS